MITLEMFPVGFTLASTGPVGPGFERAVEHLNHTRPSQLLISRLSFCMVRARRRAATLE